MIDLRDLSVQLELVRQAEAAEIVRFAQTVLMYVCLAVLVALLAFFAVRYLAPKVIAQIDRGIKAWRRLGIVGQVMLTPALGVLIVYGSTKKTVITNFDAYSQANYAVCTWTENRTQGAVSSVTIQRRLKGATEDEAWENVGACNGGIGYKVIEGFTIDKDYEYRAVYTYLEY